MFYAAEIHMYIHRSLGGVTPIAKTADRHVDGRYRAGFIVH